MNEENTLTVPARPEELDQVLEFLEQQLKTFSNSRKLQMQIAIAAEEIFVNIVHYAYPDRQDGWVTVACRMESDPPAAVIQFSDGGTPYNPLQQKDPDITLSAEERSIGGLGIFMVKKTMDQVCYKFQDGKNILTIRKLLSC